MNAVLLILSLILIIALGRGALVLFHAQSRSYQAKQALKRRLEVR